MRSSISKFVRKRMSSNNDASDKDETPAENNINGTGGDDLSPKVVVRKRKKPKDKMRSMNAAMASDDDNSLLGILGGDMSKRSEETSSEHLRTSELQETKPSTVDANGDEHQTTDEAPKDTTEAPATSDKSEKQSKDELNQQKSQSKSPTTKPAKKVESEEEEDESSGEYESSEYEDDSSEYEDDSSEYETTEEGSEEEEEEEDSDDEEPPSKSSGKKETEPSAKPKAAEVPKVEAATAQEPKPEKTTAAVDESKETTELPTEAPTADNSEPDQETQPAAISAQEQDSKPEEATANDVKETAPAADDSPTTDEIPQPEVLSESQPDTKPDKTTADLPGETTEVPTASAEHPMADEAEEDQTESETDSPPPEETIPDESEENEEAPKAPPATSSSYPDDVRAKALALLKLAGGEEEESSEEEESGSEEESSGEEEESSEYETTDEEEEGSEEEESEGEEEASAAEQPQPKTVSQPETKEAAEVPHVEAPAATREVDTDQSEPEAVSALQEESKPEDTTSENGEEETAEVPQEAPTETPVETCETDADRPDDDTDQSQPEAVSVPLEKMAEASNTDEAEADQSDNNSDQQQPQAISAPQQEAKPDERTADEPTETGEVPVEESAEAPNTEEAEADQSDDDSDQQQSQAISAPLQEAKPEEETTSDGPEETTEVSRGVSSEPPISNEVEADQPPHESSETEPNETTPVNGDDETAKVIPEVSGEAPIADEADHDDRAETSKEVAVTDAPSETTSAPFTINDKLEVVSVESDVPVSPQADKKQVTQDQDDIRNWLPQKLGKSTKEKQDNNVQEEYDASSSDSEMANKEEEEVARTVLSEGTPNSDDMYTASSEEESPDKSSAVKPLEEPDHSEVNENDSDSSEEEETSDEEDSEDEPDVEAARANLRQGEKKSGISIPSNVESIEIAAEADSIPASAFENCQQLKYVTFPPDSQVQSIGEGAFFKCESLMEMHFPQHLEIIAHEAFLGCVELRKVGFASPETLQQIERYAFFGCKQLLEIGLPADFDRIGRNAFYGCFKLNPYPITADPKILIYTGEDDGELDVPEDVTHVRVGEMCEVIPKKTFMYRHQLIQVDFRNAENLKTIEKHAFYRCDNLRDVNLSGTPLQSIGQKAFFGCKSLISICPPKTLTLVDGDALNFSGYYLYRGEADEMVPPDMKQVRVGSSVRSLQKEAFVQCEKLQEVKLTDAVQLTSIGEEAFYYSEALAEISLPDNVRIIERAAFLGCSSLAKVSFNPNLEIIGDEAFEACTSLRMIALTENVQVIGDSAFYACAKLKTVQVNDLLKVVGEEAFMMCKSLENITLPSGLDSLGENAFDQCPNLEWINLSGPDNLPLAMHIRVQYEDEAGEKLKMASLVDMYSEMPIGASKLISSENEEEVQLLEEIKAAYMLIELDRIARIPNKAKDNGFVHFLTHHLDDQTAESLASFLRASNIETVQRLANAKDNTGTLALNAAPPPVLRAFQERLMFLGRYGLQEETVVRKSDNSIVVEALDYKMEEYYEEGFDRWSLAETLDDELFCRALEDLLLIPLENSFAMSIEYFQIVDHDKKGEISKESFLSFCIEQFGRKVVLKFMRNEDQYQRELDRIGLDLDTRYVLRMLRHHDKRDTPGMTEALPGFIGAHFSDHESASDYCHLIVLPRGDRDLETIYRYEKPDGVEIKSLLREVGKALSHLHDKGLAHGNLKMSKVIRQNGHLKFSDMAASALIGSEPLGLKFSSGVLPPEMIHGVLSSSGCEQLEAYYQNASPKTRESRAPKISYMPTQMWCVVRAFLTERKGKGGSFAPRSEGLPYELLQASASADVWAFGALIYQCCTGHSLFKVDYRDSIEDGNSLRVLWDWNDLDLEASLAEDVTGDATKDILRSILQRDESLRPSMKEILRHPFFDPDTRMQDWQSTSTAPSATPHHDYVTVLNDELETPQIRNKKSVSSSRLKSALKLSDSIQGEEETVSLLEYNELSQEVDNLRGQLNKPNGSASKLDDESATLSEYKRLTDEVALLREELMISRQQTSIGQGANQIPVGPDQNTFHHVAVLCKGWLQKRRFDKRSMWKNRYFVSYEDGTVTYYHNAAELNDPTKGGCAFHLVRFRKPDEESQDTFELQTLQGEPIMQLRLSPLTVSTVEDWLGAKQRQDSSVVQKGWLQKQSRKHHQLWNDRYFLLGKTGSVVYYTNATDANNPSIGGATFPRVKWEHIADKTKKEDFDLKTMKGELIMKLRLSKLSSNSIDDWMKGNEWFEKSNYTASPTSNENVVNSFESSASGSAGLNDIVYENEVATFSGISEMGHTYDEIRLSGNIPVPQEVDAMEAISEKKESVEEGANEKQFVDELGDALPEEKERKLVKGPENVSNLTMDFSQGKKGSSSGEGLIEDTLTDEGEDELMKEQEIVSSVVTGTQGADDKPQANEAATEKEVGDENIVEELGDALPDEERNEVKESPNHSNLPSEKEAAEGEPPQEKEKSEGEIAEELGDDLPDEQEENAIDASPSNDKIVENKNVATENNEAEEVEEETKDIGVAQDVQEKQDVAKDRSITGDNGEGIRQLTEDKQLEGEPEKAGAVVQDKEKSTKDKSGEVETAQEETKDADAIQENKDVTNGISKAFQLFKRKVKSEPKQVDNVEQNDKSVSAVDEDPNVSYDYDSVPPDRFDVPPKAKQTHTQVSAVNFAGEVSYLSDDEVSIGVKPEHEDPKPKLAATRETPEPSNEEPEEVKPKLSSKAKSAARKLGGQTKDVALKLGGQTKDVAVKIGGQTQKLASQMSEKLNMDVKARRRKRREKLKKKKRLRALSSDSAASEGVVKRSSM